MPPSAFAITQSTSDAQIQQAPRLKSSVVHEPEAEDERPGDAERR